MSFWDLVNEVKAETTGTVEIKVGSFGVVPDNTRALAQVVDAKWKKFFQSESEYLSVIWEVIEPESLRGIKTEIKHKIKDLEPSVVERDGKEKAEAALKKSLGVFANIDANAGGRIVKYLSEKQQWPTEDQINAALREKPMLIGFKEWMQASGSRGNWIFSVDPKGAKPAVAGGSSKVKPMGDGGKPAQGGGGLDAWAMAGAEKGTQNGFGAGGSALDDDTPFAPQFL